VARQTISKLDKEYVRIPVSAKESGIPVNPTAYVVEMAFTTGADPTSWSTAAWETDATTEPDTYLARVLTGGIGSGASIELAAGVYTGWVRITASPERPVLKAPNLLEVI
jgi:hypothetical protein